MIFNQDPVIAVVILIFVAYLLAWRYVPLTGSWFSILVVHASILLLVMLRFSKTLPYTLEMQEAGRSLNEHRFEVCALAAIMTLGLGYFGCLWVDGFSEELRKRKEKQKEEGPEGPEGPGHS